MYVTGLSRFIPGVEGAKTVYASNKKKLPALRNRQVYTAAKIPCRNFARRYGLKPISVLAIMLITCE